MSRSPALGEGTLRGRSLSPRLPATGDPVVKTGVRETRFYQPRSQPGQCGPGSLWGDELQGWWAPCRFCNLLWVLRPLRGVARGSRLASVCGHTRAGPWQLWP